MELKDMFGSTPKVSYPGDQREPILDLGWAPGDYSNRCNTCKEMFTGDKRAWCCADCAYKKQGRIKYAID